MLQSPSREANRFATNQEIPRILWNPKVHYRIQKCHLSLSWASSIKSIPPHPTSWRPILILSSYPCLGLPSGLFPPRFPTKTLYSPLPPPYALHVPPVSFFLILSPAQYWVRITDDLANHYVVEIACQAYLRMETFVQQITVVLYFCSI